MAEETDSEKAAKMREIIESMQVKLQEIESLRKELRKEQDYSISPKKSREMLEEIIVPSLETIKEDRKRLH